MQMEKIFYVKKWDKEEFYLLTGSPGQARG